MHILYSGSAFVSFQYLPYVCDFLCITLYPTPVVLPLRCLINTGLDCITIFDILSATLLIPDTSVLTVTVPNQYGSWLYNYFDILSATLLIPDSLLFNVCVK